MVTRRNGALRVASSLLAIGALALAALPGIAAAAGTIGSGTAAQVGVVPPDGSNGGGQVRISGTVPGGGVDLRTCTFTIDEVLFDESPGGAELVLDRFFAVPAFIGLVIPASAGGKANEVKFESPSSPRPTVKLRVVDKGKGSLEFILNVDRAVIDLPLVPFPTALTTAFSVDCPGKTSAFEKTATWRSTMGSNIRTP